MSATECPAAVRMPTAANRQAADQSRTDANTRIGPCRRGPVDNYLADDLLHCWFDGPKGRWRTLGHEFHYTVLVVEVEAANLADAEAITRRFVQVHEEMYSEILVYVQAESAPATSRIRRVRWTRKTGYEVLEFVGQLDR